MTSDTADADAEVPDATPKEQGDTVETVVIDAVDELESVDDDAAEWHDARTSTVLSPRGTLPFVAICIVEVDTPIEIKAAQRWISNGAGRRRGRIYVKRSAHEQLLDADGAYLIAVYQAGVPDALDALLLVPACVLDDELDGRWNSVSASWGDGEVAKVAWSQLIAPDRVNGGDTA